MNTEMDGQQFGGAMEKIMLDVMDALSKANPAAANLRNHLLSMGMKVTVGLGGSWAEPVLYIYRERKVIPPVIKELVKTGWEGFKVQTAYLGKIAIKP